MLIILHREEAYNKLAFVRIVSCFVQSLVHELNCLNTVQHAGLYVMAASKISGWRWKEFGVKDRTHLCVAWDMGSA